jgi:methyltransferase
LASQRLAELARSRRHLSSLRRRGGTPVREPLFAAMATLHGAVLLAAPLEALLARRRPSRAVSIAAIAALGGAQLLRRAALSALGEAWSVRVTHFEDGERPVITEGLYRHLRHPNYLAVIIELAAFPLAGGAYVTAAAATLVNALLLSKRIPLEERELFTDPRYREAMEKVPRLVPLFSLRARRSPR